MRWITTLGKLIAERRSMQNERFRLGSKDVMGGPRSEFARTCLAQRSKLMLQIFGKVFERDLRASFHAVRCSGRVPTEPGPLVIFANHPSWWDGEIFVWLSKTLFADRRGYAPIDAAMLRRYPFFRKLGAFGIKNGFRGAGTFLTFGEAALAHDDGLLLVNAEGRFRDVRDRPIEVAPGLKHLARRIPSARFVPLAIEYVFWDERRPNLLLRFGQPLTAEVVSGQGNPALREALSEAMDELAADASSRDTARFVTLLVGSTRIDPIYDSWRRIKAMLRGRRFEVAHGGAHTDVK